MRYCSEMNRTCCIQHGALSPLRMYVIMARTIEKEEAEQNSNKESPPGQLLVPTSHEI